MPKTRTERQKHGAKVISRIRASLRAQARSPGRRVRLSESDQWKGYALAMARKHGVIGPDVDVTVTMHGRTAKFYSVDPAGRRWMPSEHVGKYTIPDRVWFYDPASDAILAEAWQPEPTDLELAECLA